MSLADTYSTYTAAARDPEYVHLLPSLDLIRQAVDAIDSTSPDVILPVLARTTARDDMTADPAVFRAELADDSTRWAFSPRLRLAQQVLEDLGLWTRPPFPAPKARASA